MTTLIELPETEVSFTSARAGNLSVALGDLPAASILRLIQYGTRFRNDVVNSAAKAAKDAGEDEVAAAKDAAKAWDAKLLSGDWSERRGGGGARLSAFDKALRSVIAHAFMAAGVKATDADDAAKAPDEAARRYGTAVARKQDRADLETVIDETMNAWRDRAQVIVDQQAPSIEISL